MQPLADERAEQSVPLTKAPKGEGSDEVWYPLRVVLGVRPDGTYKVRSVSNWDNNCMRLSNRNRPLPITEAALEAGLSAFMATAGNGISTIVPNCWCFHFAMHVDGTPWIGDLQVPEMVIFKAQEIIRAKA